MEYTDDQKHANFMRIVSAINHIRNGSRITEDWMFDQMKFIKMCRDFYPDMSKLNVEVTDCRWRGMAENCEMILSQLVFEIMETQSFSVPLYYTFCQNIKKMFETVLTDDEIAQLMASMTV